MPLPKSWTTVTPVSKTIAMLLFILFPFIGFSAGMRYQQRIDNANNQLKIQKDTHNNYRLTPTVEHSIDTTTWKTYYDRKKHFLIKYPKDVQFVRYFPEGGFWLVRSSETKGDPLDAKLRLDITARGHGDPIEAFYSGCPQPCNNTFTKVSINNATGVKRNEQGTDSFSEDYFLANKTKDSLLQVSLFAFNLDENDMKDYKIFQQIVRTFTFYTEEAATPSPVNSVCSQDALQCSNGVWVGRTGPNCEFVCPK